MNTKLLSIKTVANILQISVEQVSQLILSEELRSLDYEHVSEEDLKIYIKEGGIYNVR